MTPILVKEHMTAWSPRVRARRGRDLPSLQLELEFCKASRRANLGQVCPLQGLHHVHPKHPATLSVGKGVVLSVQKPEEARAQQKKRDKHFPPAVRMLWETAIAVSHVPVTCGQSLARETE